MGIYVYIHVVPFTHVYTCPQFMEVSMGSINQIINTSVQMYKKSPKVVVDIVGKPGEGKSDACIQIGQKR